MLFLSKSLFDTFFIELVPFNVTAAVGLQVFHGYNSVCVTLPEHELGIPDCKTKLSRPSPVYGNSLTNV